MAKKKGIDVNSVILIIVVVLVVGLSLGVFFKAPVGETGEGELAQSSGSGASMDFIFQRGQISAAEQSARHIHYDLIKLTAEAIELEAKVHSIENQLRRGGISASRARGLNEMLKEIHQRSGVLKFRQGVYAADIKDLRPQLTFRQHAQLRSLLRNLKGAVGSLRATVTTAMGVALVVIRAAASGIPAALAIPVAPIVGKVVAVTGAVIITSLMAAWGYYKVVDYQARSTGLTLDEKLVCIVGPNTLRLALCHTSKGTHLSPNDKDVCQKGEEKLYNLKSGYFNVDVIGRINSELTDAQKDYQKRAYKGTLRTLKSYHDECWQLTGPKA